MRESGPHCSFQSKYYWCSLEYQPESLTHLQTLVQLSTYSYRVKPCVYVWKSRRHIHTDIHLFDAFNPPASQNKSVQLVLSQDQRQLQDWGLWQKKVDASTLRTQDTLLWSWKLKNPKVCVDSSSSVPLKCLKHLVRSLAFNPTTSWHHYVTMSQICIIYAYIKKVEVKLTESWFSSIWAGALKRQELEQSVPEEMVLLHWKLTLISTLKHVILFYKYHKIMILTNSIMSFVFSNSNPTNTSNMKNRRNASPRLPSLRKSKPLNWELTY